MFWHGCATGRGRVQTQDWCCPGAQYGTRCHGRTGEWWPRSGQWGRLVQPAALSQTCNGKGHIWPWQGPYTAPTPHSRADHHGKGWTEVPGSPLPFPIKTVTKGTRPPWGEWRARVTIKVLKDAHFLRSPLSSPVGPLQQQKLLGQGQWLVINVIRPVMPMAAAISHALLSQRQNGTAPGFRNSNVDLAFFFTMPVWKGHQPPGIVTSRDKSSQPWQAHISALSCQAGPHPRWARRVQGGHACPLAKPGPLRFCTAMN